MTNPGLTTATRAASDIGLKDLLRAGVHFGHQTSRWNPKMRRYIFAERGGIYLIDLKKTLHELRRAQALTRETILSRKGVLFVCTKPQLAEIVRQEAERCGAFYVTERWLGGMLTNFQTIKKNIRRLKELERGSEEGAFEFYTKKEQLLLGRERQKLERYLSGIKEMTRVPGLVYVVDAKKEEIAVREANRLGVPVVAIADTNADPDLLTIAIAGNDDAIRSVSLITRAIADAVEMARREAPEVTQIEEEEEAYVYSTDRGESEESGRRGKKRRRARPRRRPRPEVIARRLGTTGEEAEPSAPETDAASDAGEATQTEAEEKEEKEEALASAEAPGTEPEEKEEVLASAEATGAEPEETEEVLASAEAPG
ncbi:MAG: 30S ribosomal protein S2, partial [Gemmatimonadota bacterium]